MSTVSVPLKKPEELPARSLREARGLLVVAAVAVVTGVWFFSQVHEFYTPDSPTYVIPATNLVHGNGFVNANRTPETVRTPGYPLLIAPFVWANLDLKYLVVLQHILRVLLILAAAAFCFKARGSRIQALVTGLVLCIDLPTLEGASTVMTEIPFAVVFGVAVWLLWREVGPTISLGSILMAGLLSGVSVLIRPVTIFFFVPVVIYLLLVRRSSRWRAALAFFLAFLALPLLWSVRNYRQTGYFGVSSLSGWQMMAFRGAGVLAINDPGDFESNLEKHQKQLEATACQELQSLSHKPCAEVGVAEKSKYYGRVGSRLVLHHPVAYIKLAFRGAAVMMLGGDADRLAQLTGYRSSTAKKIILIYTLPLLSLSVTGLLALWRNDRKLFYLIFLVLSYFVVVSAGAEGYSRYRVPIMPLYAITVAAGAGFILRRVVKNNSEA